jgi:pilus assembly protein CpaE
VAALGREEDEPMAGLNFKSRSKAAAATASAPTLVAAVIDEVTRETVRNVASHVGWTAPVVREGGVSAAAAYVKATGAPDFLVVDVGDSEDPVADLEALLKLCEQPTPVVAIGLLNDVRLYRRLRDIGVTDYLVKPVSVDVLTGALQIPTEAPAAPERTESKSTPLIAFVGARGGVGATTLAVSVAWAIAQQKVKVAFLDLDLHFGSAALSLDLEPSRGLRELLSHPDRIDSLLIDAAASQVGDRLKLLSAEEPLEDSIHIGPDGLVEIVNQLRGMAGKVVADVPRSLGPLTRQTMACAEVIGVVTDLSLAGMRDTQRILAMIAGAHTESKAVIIANRVGGVAGEVAVGDFERGIGAKIDHSIPFDRPAAIAAAEGAKPLIEVARNPKTVSALRSLALSFSGGGDEPPPAPSLFKRVLGR